jgi:hypothetical protein
MSAPIAGNPQRVQHCAGSSARPLPKSVRITHGAPGFIGAHQHVRRLQVLVQHPHRVRRRQRLGDLRRQVQPHRQVGTWAAPPCASAQLCQVAQLAPRPFR